MTTQENLPFDSGVNVDGSQEVAVNDTDEVVAKDSANAPRSNKGKNPRDPNAKASAKSKKSKAETAALLEAEQYKERFLRLQAEWDNFRKRTAVERESERQRAAANLVERLLPIIDDLERAIEHSESASEESLKEGIVAVQSKLGDILKKEGLKTINPLGEPFDANIHQAVGKADDVSIPDETVTQVYQKGYQMTDKVLRSAMVVISQGGPKREADESDV